MKKSHHMDTLFVLLLYSLFAILSLLLVLIGAQVYKRIVREANYRTNARASLSYVANKLRAADSAADVRIETIDGIQLLVLEGETIDTVIYYYDGGLREDILSGTDSFAPEVGERVAEIKDFSVTEDNGLYTIRSVGMDDTESVLSIFMRVPG